MPPSDPPSNTTQDPPPNNNHESEAFIRKLAGFQSVLPQYDSISAISPSYFIENVETVTQLAKCTDQEKLLILRSRIRGDALSSVINSPDLNQEKDYTEFKKKFLSYFDTQYSLGVRQKQFSNCVMAPNESVKMYAARVSVATQRFFNSPDLSNAAIKAIFEETKLAKFIDGLSARYKNSVILKDPRSFEEALNFVQSLQANDFSNDEILETQFANNTSAVSNNSEIKSMLEAHASNTTQLINNLAKEVEHLKLEQTSRRPNNSPDFQSNYRRGRDFRTSQNRSFVRSNQPKCTICNRFSHYTSQCFSNPESKNFRGRSYNDRQFQRSVRSQRYNNSRGGQTSRGFRNNYTVSENA